MYYIEFLRKKPEVTWDRFRKVVTEAHRHWATLHPDDAPILAIGRTWRLGPPDAAYMIVWKIPAFARVDEWTALRHSDVASARAIEDGTLSVADLDAGVYEDI